MSIFHASNWLEWVHGMDGGYICIYAFMHMCMHMHTSVHTSYFQKAPLGSTSQHDLLSQNTLLTEIH